VAGLNTPNNRLPPGHHCSYVPRAPLAWTQLLANSLTRRSSEQVDVRQTSRVGLSPIRPIACIARATLSARWSAGVRCSSHLESCLSEGANGANPPRGALGEMYTEELFDITRIKAFAEM